MYVVNIWGSCGRFQKIIAKTLKERRYIQNRIYVVYGLRCDVNLRNLLTLLSCHTWVKLITLGRKAPL